MIQREDDNEETIGNRLEVYRERTEPLINFYGMRDKLTAINAEGSIDEVYERLVQALTEILPRGRIRRATDIS